MTISNISTHRLVALASLSPETEKLWRALPRGVRITRDRLLGIAAPLGFNRTSALLRIATLRRAGFVEEFFARDGSLESERSEWRVVE